MRSFLNIKFKKKKIKDAIEDKKALNILEEEIKKINNNISLLNKKKKEMKISY